MLLTLLIFLPLAGAPVVLIAGRGGDHIARVTALVISLATFGVAVWALTRFYGPSSGFQLVADVNWVSSAGLRYIVGVDGLTIFLILLTAFMMPVALLASWKIDTNVARYMAAFLILETGMLGTFLSLDLIQFFLFFEAILFPMYLLIGVWGGKRRVYAAVKFFVYTMAGSALLLVAVLYLGAQASHQLGHLTFDIRQLQGLDLSLGAGRWLFLAFLIAFAVKVPLFPLHTWLPDAHTEAPTAGSVILAAVMLKIGAFGLIRFNLLLFPEASHYFAGFVSVLALIGIVYGALCALRQSDIKRLIAYSSVSHLGFVVLGTFAFTSMALSGSILQMINHGLSTGALFLLIGMAYERTHTRDLDQLGGLAKVMPVFAGLYLIAALSSLGLPGLNNFVGEFLVIVGSFSANHLFGIIAATGVVLGAIYLLWSYQRMMQGEPRPEHSHHPDLTLRERIVVAPVLIAMLVIGIVPNLLLRSIEPTVNHILDGTGRAPAVAVVQQAQPQTAPSGEPEVQP